ncbi:DNAj-like protein [Leptomonas pyrrhocoris]|uniref:DNAj-like protein n=1 Tax=Leptomonas pyrrhocoris TaxID=157538 RepID=A0A0M9G0A8_LEPPY|nr:DNAj-like protein [Leptomonas pyrrhocoris]KPA79557.1 DNAj-like protein [Leptomonas pyrrhocoris]|eukprot:XP_015657996.1 DNAj-like protein [Leptomonas pyrrhocoris]
MARRYRFPRAVVALLIFAWVVGLCVQITPLRHASATSDNDANTMKTILGLPEDDFYGVLGLSQAGEDATESQIKSAFRRLSRKYHPDVVAAGDEESFRQVYQRIQRAYEVLGDRRKRRVYDILGVEGLKKLEQPQQQQHMNPFFALFGGGGQAASDKGQDKELLMVVPLEDVYKGATHTFQFTKRKICRACHGNGARSKEDVVRCPHCKGSGRLVQRIQIAPGFVQQIEQVCSHCNGKGTHVAHMCPVCRGKAVVSGETALSVDIEEGLPEGHVLRYELEADQTPGQVPGDVMLTVVTAPHAVFTRDGNDLYMNVTITLKEALLGFERSFTHLDGHEVALRRTGVTQYAQQARIVGEGMPRHHVPSEHGDLYVTYNVELPRTLSAEQREMFDKHFK